jgi:hypothetical protein
MFLKVSNFKLWNVKFVIPCRILNVCKRMMALGGVVFTFSNTRLFGMKFLLSSCLYYYLLYSS